MNIEYIFVVIHATTFNHYRLRFVNHDLLDKIRKI